jgi:hypothetical protein
MMRWFAGLLCALCVAGTQAETVVDAVSIEAPGGPLSEIESAAAAFTRGAALPAWADLAQAPPVPPQDSHRSAVVRLWETQLHVAPSPTRLTHRVLQVNDVSALAQIGQIALDFNPRFERLLLHRIMILRGERTIEHTRTAPLRFLQREPKLEDGVYSGVITALVVLPGVRAGDSLQVVYSIVGDNPALGSRYAQRVPWDQLHPTVQRRVTLVAPAQRKVSWRWLGGAGGDGPRPTETVEAGMRRLLFVGHNVVAATGEPMMPPHVQPMRQLQFSEYASWHEVAQWGLAVFPAPAPLPEAMTPLMDRLRALPDAQEQVSQALQWVQGEIRHWAAATGEGALRPRAPALVLQRGYGDCKDKALLLISMLHALGIQARPVLVAAANHNDPPSMLPAPGDFDHVIVQVRLDGREYYLDPTRQGQAGLLSHMGQRFEGAAVLPIDATTQDLVIVRSPNREQIFRSQMQERLSLASFDAEGRLDVEIRWFGVNAESVRTSIRNMNAAELRHFAAATYQQQYAGARLLGEPQVRDDRHLNELTMTASFAVPDLVRASGDVWAVPYAPALGGAIVLPSQRVRRFPLLVPSFPMTYHYVVEMTWPEGVKIIGESTSRRLETPHFRMLTTRQVSGSSERRSVEFEAKVSEVPPFEIQSLANDLNRMAQQIGSALLAERTGEPHAASPATSHDGSTGDRRPPAALR